MCCPFLWGDPLGRDGGIPQGCDTQGTVCPSIRQPGPVARKLLTGDRLVQDFLASVPRQCPLTRLRDTGVSPVLDAAFVFALLFPLALQHFCLLLFLTQEHMLLSLSIIAGFYDL